jgi:hypothetical protein
MVKKGRVPDPDPQHWFQNEEMISKYQIQNQQGTI